jgi:hypothetical protein
MSADEERKREAINAIKFEPNLSSEVAKALATIAERGDVHNASLISSALKTEIGLREAHKNGAAQEQQFRSEHEGNLKYNPIAKAVADAAFNIISSDVTWDKHFKGDPQLVNTLVTLAGEQKRGEVEAFVKEIQKGDEEIKGYMDAGFLKTFDAFGLVHRESEKGLKEGGELRNRGIEHLNQALGPSVDARIDEVIAPPRNNQEQKAEKRERK